MDRPATGPEPHCPRPAVATARGLRDLEQLDRVFAALAHQSRRTILMVLHLRGGEMTSGAVAARTRLPPQRRTRDASLPLLLLIAAGNQPLGEVVTGQLMAEEIVGSVVGTFGLIVAVPITSALAALAAGGVSGRHVRGTPRPRRPDPLEAAWASTAMSATVRTSRG